MSHVVHLRASFFPISKSAMDFFYFVPMCKTLLLKEGVLYFYHTCTPVNTLNLLILRSSSFLPVRAWASLGSCGL